MPLAPRKRNADTLRHRGTWRNVRQRNEVMLRVIHASIINTGPSPECCTKPNLAGGSLKCMLHFEH